MNARKSIVCLIAMIMVTCLNVKSQSSITGNVTNLEISEPFQYVTVEAVGSETYTTETDSNGDYNMIVEAGSYDLFFTKYGFDTVLQTVVVPENTPITQNAELYMYPYPPRNVTYVLNYDVCTINIDPPIVANELIYDDGSFDGSEYWSQEGGYFIVKFTPDTYPAKVKGCRVNVGDGTLPPYGGIIGKTIGICLFDDDGTDEMPGTLIESFNISVDNYNWIDLYDCFDYEIETGSYYIGVLQMHDSPDCPPIAIDTTGISDYVSFKRENDNSDWEQYNTGNYMIRSTLEEDGKPVDYETAILEYFDPCVYPEGAVYTLINRFQFTFLDPPSFFCGFAVRANYVYDQSVWAYSNILSPSGDINVQFNISLCDQEPIDSAYVIMNGTTCGFTDFHAYSDSVGFAEVDTVLSDIYQIVVSHYGYNDYVDTVEITGDTLLNIELTEIIYSPINLYANIEWFAFNEPANKIGWSSPYTSCIVSGNRNARQVEQFYVYRMDDQSAPSYYLYDSVVFIPEQLDYIYYDTVPNVSLMAGYYYQVTACYSSCGEVFESSPAFSLVNPEEDFVYIFLENAEENSLIGNDIRVSPNPAKEKVNIVCENMINSVTFYNLSGNIVFLDRNINSISTSVNLEDFSPGLYLVKIETKNDFFIRKMIVSK